MHEIITIIATLRLCLVVLALDMKVDTMVYTEQCYLDTVRNMQAPTVEAYHTQLYAVIKRFHLERYARRPYFIRGKLFDRTTCFCGCVECDLAANTAKRVST